MVTPQALPQGHLCHGDTQPLLSPSPPHATQHQPPQPGSTLAPPPPPTGPSCTETLGTLGSLPAPTGDCHWWYHLQPSFGVQGGSCRVLGGPPGARVHPAPPPHPLPGGFIGGDTHWGQLFSAAGTMYGNIESSQAGQGQMWELELSGGEGREHPRVLDGVGPSPAVPNAHPMSLLGSHSVGGIPCLCPQYPREDPRMGGGTRGGLPHPW